MSIESFRNVNKIDKCLFYVLISNPEVFIIKVAVI